MATEMLKNQYVKLLSQQEGHLVSLNKEVNYEMYVV